MRCNENLYYMRDSAHRWCINKNAELFLKLLYFVFVLGILRKKS